MVAARIDPEMVEWLKSRSSWRQSDLDKLRDHQKDLVPALADPPYGVDYTGGSTNDRARTACIDCRPTKRGTPA